MTVGSVDFVCIIKQRFYPAGYSGFIDNEVRVIAPAVIAHKRPRSDDFHYTTVIAIHYRNL